MISIFSAYFFLLLNLLIILFTEVSGDFFEESGIIHIFAVIFVLINFILLRYFYSIGDVVFRAIFKSWIFSVLFLAFAHCLEFFANNSFVEVSPGFKEAVDINVILAYIIFFYLVLMGVTSVVNAIRTDKATDLFAKRWSKYSLLIPILTVSLMIIFFVRGFVSINWLNENLLSYIVVFSTFCIFLVTMITCSRIARFAQQLKVFLVPYQIGFVFIMAAAFAELLETFSELENHLVQITYLSHYAYYIGLSFMIIGMIRMFKTQNVLNINSESLLK